MNETYFKRFLARMIDFTVNMDFILLILAKGFRYNIALAEKWEYVLLSVFVCASMILTDTCLLVLFGTTVGKAVFGLYPCGERKIDWKMSFERAKLVYVYGMGCGIPVLMQIFWFRCAFRGQEDKWQIKGEYRCKSGKMAYLGFLFMTVLLAAAEVFSSRWAEYPVHKGRLSAAEYAENLEDYQRYYRMDTPVVLNDQGTWEETLDREGSHTFISVQETEHQVTKVCMEQSIESDTVSYCNTDLVVVVTKALMEAQEGWVYSEDYRNLLEELWSEDKHSFSMECGDWSIKFDVELEDGIYMASYDYLVSEDDLTLKYKMKYEIEYSGS